MGVPPARFVGLAQFKAVAVGTPCLKIPNTNSTFEMAKSLTGPRNCQSFDLSCVHKMSQHCPRRASPRRASPRSARDTRRDLGWVRPRRASELTMTSGISLQPNLDDSKEGRVVRNVAPARSGRLNRLQSSHHFPLQCAVLIHQRGHTTEESCTSSSHPKVAP